MEINLLEVIKYNKKCLQDKTLLRNIISDKYPQNVREMNVLLNVYDIGVLRDIACNASITELQYSSYVQKLINTYGLQEQLAIQGLNAWIDVFLGTGYSARFSDTSKTASDNKTQKVIGTIEDYELTMLSDNTAEIKAFVGADVEDMVVPAEIDGVRIVGIGEDAYRGHKGIKRLIISEGIEYIKDAAFFMCSSLEKVMFPTSLTELGRKGRTEKVFVEGTFGKCESLSEITIPGTVAKIGQGLFLRCKNLRSVYLSEGITEIGEDVFRGCENLSEITIPGTVAKIGKFLFTGCEKLRSVYLNEGLTEIGLSAFSYCVSLSEIKVPSTVTKIEMRAFMNCTKLRSVHLNEGLGEISASVFMWCDSLSEIKIPSTVTRIGVRAFKGCKNLSSVQLNEGLIEIEEEAFDDCDESLKILLPSTVKRVDSSQVFVTSKEKRLSMEEFDALMEMKWKELGFK